MTHVSTERRTVEHLGVKRCAAAGGFILGVVFVACWLFAAIAPTLGSHLYVSLFTMAPTGSREALVNGLAASMLAGVAVGALVALTYNLLAFLAPAKRA